MIRAGVVLSLCVIAWQAPSWSQDLSHPPMSASASKTNVLIAEPFTVRVEVLASPGSQVKFPDVIGEEKTQLGDFDVLATQTLDDIPLDDPNEKLRRWTRTLTLETLRLGRQTIPSMSAIVTREGAARTLTSEPIEINVNGVLESQDETLRDISGSIESEIDLAPAEYNQSVWWLLGIAAIVVTLASVLGFRWWRSRRRPLRWCRQELSQLESELQSIRDASTSIHFEDWTQRLRGVLRTAVGAHQTAASRLPSTKQLFIEIKSIDETCSMTACERLLRELDRARFSTEAASLPSEPLLAKASDALIEAESLLDHLVVISSAKRRGV